MLDVITWFVPGVAVSVLLGLVVARPLARRLRTSPPVALLFIVGLGAILSATLTPIAPGIDGPPSSVGTCDFHRMTLAPLAVLMRINDTSLNVALFMPIGLAVGLLPWSWQKVMVLIVALALPFLVETVQLLAPSLDRSCESADVIDNLTGLFAGLIAGTVLGLTVAAARLAIDVAKTR